MSLISCFADCGFKGVTKIECICQYYTLLESCHAQQRLAVDMEIGKSFLISYRYYMILPNMFAGKSTTVSIMRLAGLLKFKEV